MPFETLMKRLPTGAETFVVQNHCQGPNVVTRGSLDLHAGQTEGAVPRDIDHGLIRMGQFRAHGRGCRPAHRAGAAEADEAVGKQRLVMVRDIGARHAGVVQQNRIAAIEAVGQVPTSAVGIYGDFVGSEPLIPGIHPLLFELADFFDDNTVHPLAPPTQFLRPLLKQRLQKKLYIREHDQVRGVIFVQLRRIDVHLHELRVGRLGQPTGSRVLPKTAT